MSSRKKKPKFKYNDKLNIADNLDILCSMFELNDDAKKAIATISKKSYLKGNKDGIEVARLFLD